MGEHRRDKPSAFVVSRHVAGHDDLVVSDSSPTRPPDSMPGAKTPHTPVDLVVSEHGLARPDLLVVRVRRIDVLMPPNVRGVPAALPLPTSPTTAGEVEWTISPATSGSTAAVTWTSVLRLQVLAAPRRLPKQWELTS
jgi:hypothetical protein